MALKVYECLGFNGDNYEHVILSMALVANTFQDKQGRAELLAHLSCSGVTIYDIDFVVAREVQKAAYEQRISPILIIEESRKSMEEVFRRTAIVMKRYNLLS